MEKYVITGGNRLVGEVTVSGAKNAAVAILPAMVLIDGTCRIENMPDISDVSLIIDILYKMGARVKYINRNCVEINCARISNSPPPYELVRKMRASYYLLGGLLGRFHNARISLPGGCDFGVRPIDQHIKGFEAMGASVNIVEGGMIEACAEDGLSGSSIYLDVVSVGATINIMIAATRANGITVIENAAREPHIVDLANFLNSMGADIKGAGTATIKIRGVDHLHGGSYSIIPDQIEAGTYMVMAAATGGQVLIKNVIPKHLESITAKLDEIGVYIEEFDDSILVKRTGPLLKANIKTLPYPGFPTDMQPQLTMLLCLANGTSIITESVWNNRFRYVDELKRMGASIQVDGHIAVVEGVGSLVGAPVKSCDLRAGAAMIAAALSASGVTELEDIQYVERGYENIIEKLRGLGADIIKINIADGNVLAKVN